MPPQFRHSHCHRPICLGLFGGTLLSTQLTLPVLAQSMIVPDDTLGEEDSQLQLNIDVNGFPVR